MLFYIGKYIINENTQNRRVFLAAVNKMRYIINIIYKNGIKYEIVSCCSTDDNKSQSGEYIKMDDGNYFRSFKSLGSRNQLIRVLDTFFLKIQLFCYLIKKVKSGDTLLVYHSLSYSGVIYLIKKIKKCHLILEVEEFYYNISGKKCDKRQELKLFSTADGFIFSTEMLNDVANKKNKPYIVIHGTYNVEVDRKKRFVDNKIHIVYAGTFNSTKGGAFFAVESAELLDKNYHMHIIGFGSHDEKKKLLKDIEDVVKKSECVVTYDGCLSGGEYIEFIQSCDIGLSTQNPDASYNATSFPSKILSYMANGLRVVSIKIPAVENSDVGDYIYYYNKQSAEEMAQAIKNVDFNDNYDGRKIISELHKKFSKEISSLLKGFGNDK